MSTMVKEIIRYENGKKITILQGEGLGKIIPIEEGKLRMDAYMKTPEWTFYGRPFTRPIATLFYYFWYIRLKWFGNKKKVS
jgi:hypothetical protein